MNDYATFIQAVIDTLRASPLASRMTIEEYDGRYESDQALKIVGDETVCFVFQSHIGAIRIAVMLCCEGAVMLISIPHWCN
jgi:hypothetical protein